MPRTFKSGVDVAETHVSSAAKLYGRVTAEGSHLGHAVRSVSGVDDHLDSGGSTCFVALFLVSLRVRRRGEPNSESNVSERCK